MERLLGDWHDRQPARRGATNRWHLLRLRVRASLTRVLILLAAGLLIVLVGFSRMYLGAHYLSDVLGAIAEGLAWLSLCLTVVYTMWERSR